MADDEFPAWLIRVRDERTALIDKIMRLRGFLADQQTQLNPLGTLHTWLLQRQLESMSTYAEILEFRLYLHVDKMDLATDEERQG